MSFSDFGRTAMAALSPTAASQPPPSGVSKSRNTRRASDPLPPTLDGRRRTKNSRDNVGGNGGRRSDGGAMTDRKGTTTATANYSNTLEIRRGVRPRLDGIQCPVTKKTLTDDVLTVQSDVHTNASLASTSISSSTTQQDPSYSYSFDEGSEDVDGDDYSESDIGLNQSNSRDEARRRRNYRISSSSGGRNGTTSGHSNSHGNHQTSSYLDGRKGSRQTHPDSPQRRRRLPKHYNNISDTTAAAPDRGRATRTTTPRGGDSLSKKKALHTPTTTKKKPSAKDSRSNPTVASPATKLSTEVAQFQKMVADLAAVSGSSASSPEAMWKARILTRSAQDAERDLKLTLATTNDEDGTTQRGVAAAARAASRKKLQRDYHRASEQLRSIVEETERRQKAEVSCLTAKEAATNFPEDANAAAASQKRLAMGAAEAEEDFFDRAMRERHAEVQKISDGMKKVQDIYSDLAGLVDGQQEQIDKLEDINEEVKEDTRAGLEEIQHGIWKLCAADAPTNDGVEANMDEFKKMHSNSNSNRKKVLDANDLFNCMMACHGPPQSQGGGSGGILSLQESYEQRTGIPKTRNANYYDDDVSAPGSEMAWNLPNLEDVQESAQDAYERGHAMVGGLVSQVQEAVAKGEVLPVQLRECTPQPPEEYSSSETTEDSGTLDDILGTCDEKDRRNGGFDEKRHRLDHPRSEGQQRRHSHSRSHSRQHQQHHSKHQNRHFQDGQWREDDYRKYDESPRKKERSRLKGRNSSSR